MMNMKEEIMNDMMDDAMEDEEEDAEQVVNKVLDELGLEMGGEMSSLPGAMSDPVAQPAAPTVRYKRLLLMELILRYLQPVAEGGGDLDADLEARLNNLRR